MELWYNIARYGDAFPRLLRSACLWLAPGTQAPLVDVTYSKLVSQPFFLSLSPIELEMQ
jgi:hypothetical protein